jgi:hypothetical protein
VSLLKAARAISHYGCGCAEGFEASYARRVAIT